MDQKPTGSLRHGSLPFTGIAAALLAGFAAAVTGCPGPAPHEGLGGSGGEASSSTTTSSSSTSSSSTSSTSTSSTSTSSSTSLTSTSSSTSTSSTSTTLSSSTSSSSSGTTCPIASDVCALSESGGWSAPFELYVSTGTSPPPSCTGGVTPVLTGDLSLYAPVPTCPVCGCGAPTDVVCEEPTASVWNGQSCGNLASCATGTLTSKCSQLPTSSPTSCVAAAAGVYLAVSAQATGGSCAPSPAPPPPAPPTWGGHAAGCPLDTGLTSCTGGVCTAVPSSAQLCISQLGAQTCPTAYPKSTSVYTGYTDTRGCSPCTCGTPEAQCTGGTATFSAAADCTAGETIAVPLTCTLEGLLGATQYYGVLTTPPTPSGGQCAPSTSSAIGSATPTGLTTVCCM